MSSATIVGKTFHSSFNCDDVSGATTRRANQRTLRQAEILAGVVLGLHLSRAAHLRIQAIGPAAIGAAAMAGAAMAGAVERL